MTSLTSALTAGLCWKSCRHELRFVTYARRAELVAMPEGPHPIPSRTRPLSPPGSMVLRLKAWESRSLPAQRDAHIIPPSKCGLCAQTLARRFRGGFCVLALADMVRSTG